MPNISMTYAGGVYDRLLPLFKGDVHPKGIDLTFIPFEGGLGKRNMFDRMAATQEFDCSEYSSSEFICKWAAGRNPFVAIPAFPSRVFRHSMIAINKKSGIKSPKDLEGKRVGVPVYTMTAAVMARGALKQQFGVDYDTIRWVQGAVNRAGGGSHGTPSTEPVLRKVNLEDNKSGKPLTTLLEEGELDAILGTVLPDSVWNNPDIVRLFPNFKEVEKEYYLKTKIFPIMHLVAIRKDFYEKHKFVAGSLYDALVESKNIQRRYLLEGGSLPCMVPWMSAELDEVRTTFGGDAFPYGIEKNRSTLEGLVSYLHDQGMIAKKMNIEDLFVPVVGDN